MFDTQREWQVTSLKCSLFNVIIIQLTDSSAKEEYIRAFSKQILEEIRKDILLEPGTSTPTLEHYITKKEEKPQIIMVGYFMN